MNDQLDSGYRQDIKEEAEQALTYLKRKGVQHMVMCPQAEAQKNMALLREIERLEGVNAQLEDENSTFRAS